MDNRRLYLLDATAFCYRAFYAVKGLSTSFGQPTGAIYGFVNILNKIIKDHKPEYLAVCFDVSRETFRSKIFAEYKIQRPPTPEGLSSQIPLIKEIASAYGFSIIEKEGYEADDIIANFSKRAKALGLSVTIVSSDKDMLQLVTDGVEVFNPYKDDGVFYKTDTVEEYFGVKPGQVADVISLMGDSADNIPGIPGIGEKTALSLIREFGSLDNLLKHSEMIGKEKIRQAILDNKDTIQLNKRLAVLSGDLEIEFNLDDLMIKKADQRRLADLFRRLEFKKFLANLNLDEEGGKAVGFDECEDNDLDKLFNPGEELFLFIDEANSVFFYSGKKIMRLKKAGNNFRRILMDSEIKKIGHDLKTAKVVLAREGIGIEGFYFDTMIAGYLLNPSRSSYSLDSLALEYLGKIPNKKVPGPQDSLLLIRELEPKLRELLKEKNLLRLFNEIEMPLADVLAEMQLCGIKLDVKFLASLSSVLNKRLNKLISAIYDLSGEEFNINSPKQLRVVLFDKLKLPVIKKTKTGPSTDEDVLNKLATKHKLPALLLEYRQLTKLKTTYIDALPQLVNKKTGRVHTSFNQCVTETGRLSSSEPNLQNIPVKTEIGREIRRAIVASDSKNILVSCDYSQVELRMLAHLSKDEDLIKAFIAGEDVHKITASLIYGITEEEVTPEMRDTAKRVNFGIVYGLTSFGLSRDLGIGIDEAQAFIDAYFIRYPKVKDYIDSEIKLAEENGYVTTILGRRRYIPEIKSKNIAVRQFAQRQAVNTPLQGSASDLIKLAMINIRDEIRKKKLKSMMVLQIHDELLFDLPKSELPALVALARDKMENVLKLTVPVVVDIKKGDNWMEMVPCSLQEGLRKEKGKR